MCSAQHDHVVFFVGLPPHPNPPNGEREAEPEKNFRKEKRVKGYRTKG
jgi:hypothetical protein